MGPGPPLSASASRALSMGLGERGAPMPMLTTATMVMASVTGSLTTEATPPPTLIGLPKASALVTASTTARGVQTLLPTVSARGRLNPQLMLMLRPIPTMVTTVMVAGTATDLATTVDITVTVMAMAMVMVTTAELGIQKIICACCAILMENTPLTVS